MSMSIDKVIEILESGKAPETEQDFEDFDYAIETAINLLKTYRDSQRNDPLALEQLREMHGEPMKVVRCKDCKHLYFKDFSGFCPHRVSACSPDGFCEYGERRKPEESEAALKGWANRESLL